MGHDAIARRLALRWRLPDGIGRIVGQLNLPIPFARFSAADADLLAVVQLAVAEAEARTIDLGLTRGADRQGLLAHLALDPDRITALGEPLPSPALPPQGTNPHLIPLLPNLLRMAGDARRRNGASLVVRLEERIDELQHALASTARSFEARVLEARLRGLAELAAGAGHEINNPLAVISGHAQRLRHNEPDPDRDKVLRTIERQTDRIASLIRGLMQFARPTRPQPRQWPAADLFADLKENLAWAAEARQIDFRVEGPPPGFRWRRIGPRCVRRSARSR